MITPLLRVKDVNLVLEFMGLFPKILHEIAKASEPLEHVSTVLDTYKYL